MKKFILFPLLILFSTLAFSQPAMSNAWTSWTETNYRNSVGEITGKYIKATFTMDSLGVILLSKPFSLEDFAGNDWANYPAFFRFKCTSTAAGPNSYIRILGCYGSVTDTAFTAETMRTYVGGQLETDSIGILAFDAAPAQALAPQYRVAIGNVGSDVNAGILDLFFRKQKQKP